MPVIKCMNCDQGMAELPEDSIDLIFTDPPYVKDQYKEAYELLAKHGPRLLKPSAFLITYVPQYRLNEVMRIMESGLEYYWICSQINNRESIMVHQKKAICLFKPIIIYQKPPKKPCKNAFVDVIKGHKQKAFHPWEQSIHDALHLLSRFAGPGDMILDPFMGSGTTILAAKLLGLEAIGFEIDPDTYRTASERLNQSALNLDRFKAKT